MNSNKPSTEKPQGNVASLSALKSRLCYVVQVVVFIVAILGLVMFLTVDYVGTSEEGLTNTKYFRIPT